MLLNAVSVLNLGERVHWEGSVIFNPALKRVWFYCSIISWRKSLGGWKKLKDGREKEWKEPWEISHPILQAPQLPCSSHSPHWLSIAAANLLGEKPHAGKKWNCLNSSTTRLPHSTVLLLLSIPSSILLSLSGLPAHQRPGRETWRLAWSHICLHHSSFCTAAFTPHSSLTPGFVSYANSLPMRGREGGRI